MTRLAKIPAGRYLDFALFLALGLFPLTGLLFYTQLLQKYLVFLIFAYSLDLLWGYAGLMDLGHAVLFGMGGYLMALSLSAQNGVPEFMARYGVREVPAWLAAIVPLPAAVLAGILIPALFAGLLGRFLFSSRVGGVFFSVITLALAQVFNLFIQSQQKYTGGFNGIGGLPGLALFGRPLDLVQGYYLVFAVVLLVYAFCRGLTASRFGLVLRGIRENGARLEFLGYDPARFKTAVFMVSGALAGLAGVLYVDRKSTRLNSRRQGQPARRGARRHAGQRGRQRALREFRRVLAASARRRSPRGRVLRTAGHHGRPRPSRTRKRPPEGEGDGAPCVRF